MIGENVLRAEPFENVFVFDIHAHINQTSDFQMLDSDPAQVAATIEKLGISGACVSSILSIHADCALGNSYVIETTKKFPGKIYGYVTVSPHHNDVDIDSYFKEPGILGMKVHAAFHRAAIDDPRYTPFFEYADKHSLPVLFHTWEIVDIIHVANIASRYKNAKLIIGHGAMRLWEVKREVIEAVQKHENVFADTTISVAYDGAIEYAAKKLGVGRLCYGSDIPFYDCRHVVGKVATSRLSDADKEKILGENARKILNLR